MENTSDLLSHILTHGPSQNTIFIVLTKMKEEGRTSEIMQGCLKALSIFPDDIRLRNLLAEAYLDEGSYNSAEIELSKSTAEIEKLTATYKLQARLYEQQEKFEDAAESLKKYLTFNPEDQEAIDLNNRIAQQTDSDLPDWTAQTDNDTEPVKATEDEPLDKTPEEIEAVEPELEVKSALMYDLMQELPAEETTEPETIAEPEAEEHSGLKLMKDLVEELTEVEAVKPELEEGPTAKKTEKEINLKDSIEDEAESSEIEKEVTDLATPTLAKLYSSQGQIQEAINTYEKIVRNNPNDKESEQHLNKLKASLEETADTQSSKEDELKKAEKSIEILEGWLSRIQGSLNV